MISTEFDDIFEPATEPNRPVMSRPPWKIASRKLISATRAELSLLYVDLNDEQALNVADWLADKLERFGASQAEPVFTMAGVGPVCSWCGAIWPLCGHHHLTTLVPEDEEEDS